jgi:hypothetical protein
VLGGYVPSGNKLRKTARLSDREARNSGEQIGESMKTLTEDDTVNRASRKKFAKRSDGEKAIMMQAIVTLIQKINEQEERIKRLKTKVAITSRWNGD